MSKTTPRERVLTSVRHRQPDRIPHFLGFTLPARRKLEAHLGTTDLDEAVDNHLAIFSTRRNSPWEEVRPGHWRDAFGVVWNRTVDPDIGVVDENLLSRPSLEGYQFPDPRDPVRYRDLPAFIEKNRDRFRLVTHGFSLFERAWSLRGMPELLTDMVDDPAFVDALLDGILEHNLGVVEELAGRDVDGILFGDDWASQRGLIMGPLRWRRFIRPRLQAQFDAVRRAGKVVCIHCCGKVDSLFPDLIEMGLEVFNPFQPEVMDPVEMKRLHGDRLSFYGGMSIQRVLPHGTPAQVRDEARRLIDEVGRDGGFIIAPSHEMPGDIPVENMIAFLEAVRAG